MNLKNYLRSGTGATDITPLFSNKDAFHTLIQQLSDLCKRDGSIDKIACIEGRGFILGSAVAFRLGVGLIPIRQKGKLKNDVYSLSFIDYSGKEKILEIHKDAIKVGEKIVIIDDWVETGATIKTAITLIEKCGGNIVGINCFMDDSNEELKKQFARYNYKFLERVISEDKF